MDGDDRNKKTVIFLSIVPGYVKSSSNLDTQTQKIIKCNVLRLKAKNKLTIFW